MTGLHGILLQEFMVFKRKWVATSLGMLISPMLYLIAFGWGLGSDIELSGMSYLDYVIPGIIAMSTMMISFSNTANTVQISRLYYETFEGYMISPIKMSVYATGKIMAGACYGLYSATIITIVIGIFNGFAMVNPFFVILAILNSLVFSSLGFLLGLLVKSHAGMSKFTNFIITPMSFLCGTFFPLDKMPDAIKYLIYVLPLTQTNLGMRNIDQTMTSQLIHIAVLLVYLIVLYVIGIRVCKNIE
jgi:Nod factor-specific ABC transporter NodJ protein